MDIKTPRDLDKILVICRKRGVQSISIGNISINLSAEAPKSTYLKKKALTAEPIPSPYTDEQILYWSAQGGEVANG